MHVTHVEKRPSKVVNHARGSHAKKYMILRQNKNVESVLLCSNMRQNHARPSWIFAQEFNIN